MKGYGSFDVRFYQKVCIRGNTWRWKDKIFMKIRGKKKIE